MGCVIFNATLIKGQLNSEWIYEVIVSPKMPTKKGFLPYPLKSFQGRNPGNFWLAIWEKWWPYEFILNLTDLYWLAATRNPNVPLEFALLTLFPLGRNTFFFMFWLKFAIFDWKLDNYNVTFLKFQQNVFFFQLCQTQGWFKLPTK